MLTIRKEQQRLFDDTLLEVWVAGMTQFIASDYPRQFQAMSDSGTRDFIFRAIAKGRANHVDTQGGLSVLIELMIQFGEDFERSRDKEWGDEILGHATLPAQLKLTLMYGRMTEKSKGRVVVPFQEPERAVGA